MKKYAAIALVILLLLQLMAGAALAADEPAFVYTLAMTDANGNKVTDPSSLSAGSKVTVALTIKRTDISDSYTAVGVEMTLTTKGMTYGQDAEKASFLNVLTATQNIAGTKTVSFRYVDLAGVGITVDNPLEVGSCSFTIDSADAASLKVTTALVYLGTSESYKVSEAPEEEPACTHTNTSKLEDTPATCTEPGKEGDVICKDCKEVVEEGKTIPATGHTEGEPEIENEVDATCDVNGSYDEVVYCEVCGEELRREQNSVPATGHDWGEWEVGEAAGCEEPGSEIRYCKNDSTHTEERDVNPTGHTEGQAVKENEEAATCENDGYYDEVVYCEVCGEELSCEEKTIPATGHIAGEPEIENEVDATCEYDGSYDEVVYCEVCGAELDREGKTTPAIGHDWGDWESWEEAGCEEPGSEIRYCKNDSTHTEERDVNPTGHTEGQAVKENEEAATCTEDGSYDEVVYCEVCGAELGREAKTIPATGHDWGDWEIWEEAGCEEPGSEIRYCKNDSTHSEARDVDPTGHTEGEAVKENEVDATCTEDGSYDEVVYCSECDEELNREKKTVPAGHTEGEAVKENEVDATCTEDGSYDEVVYCSKCGEELSREKKVNPAKGHTEVVDAAVEPTCTEAGKSEGKHCSVCDEVLVAQETVAALGHTEEAIPAVEATCTETGLTAGVKCSVCGEILTAQENVAAKGHTEEVDAAVAATCTEAGKTEGTHCSVCDEVLAAQETIPATGHNWDEGKVTKEATSTEKGVKTYTCKNDASHVKTEEIPVVPAKKPEEQKPAETKPTNQQQESKPSATVPSTGDNNRRLMAALVLCLVSAAGMLTVMLIPTKKRR